MQTIEKDKIQVLDFLNRKNAYIKEFLEISESAVFKNDFDDVVIYSNMMAKREHILNEIKNIDANLEKENYKNILKSDDKNIVGIINEIQDNCKKIVSGDVSLNNSMEKLYFEIKDKIKEINQGKNINSAYKNYAVFDNSVFDRSN